MWALELRNGGILLSVAIQPRATRKGIIFFLVVQLARTTVERDAGGVDTAHAGVVLCTMLYHLCARRVVPPSLYPYRSCGGVNAYDHSRGVRQWDGHEGNGVGHGTNSMELI